MLSCSAQKNKHAHTCLKISSFQSSIWKTSHPQAVVDGFGGLCLTNKKTFRFLTYLVFKCLFTVQQKFLFGILFHIISLKSCLSLRQYFTPMRSTASCQMSVDFYRSNQHMSPLATVLLVCKSFKYMETICYGCSTWRITKLIMLFLLSNSLWRKTLNFSLPITSL